MTDSGFWMRQVVSMAQLLSRSELRFKSGQIDEYELARIRAGYRMAVEKYTDPFGVRNE